MATNQDSIKLYLPAEDAQALREIAKRDDRTVAAILRRLIRDYIQKHG